MKRWLQQFGFRECSYNRPNQDWVCGREDGRPPCAMGPDPKGGCHASFECRPYRDGDRWVCNRPRRGSDEQPCEKGPSPEGVCGCPMPTCSPRRSVRALRTRIVMATLALSLAAMALLLTSERGRVFMTPGELSSAHAFPNGTCADCHDQGDAAPIHWLANGASNPHAASSAKCLDCHDLGPAGTNPHSLPDNELAEWSARAAATPQEGLAQPPIRVAMSKPLAAHSSEIACAACHQEHRGRNHDLTAIANQQCQVCHQNQFTQFAQGHPPFGDYPFRERNRIVFDHKTHFQTHFKQDSHKDTAPESCLACHQVDAKGDQMLIKPFELSCASCHNKDFSGFDANAATIPFLRIPLMDIEGFEDAEIPVGEWPDDWDSLETTLPPFTQFLLGDSEKNAQAVAQMSGKDLDVIEEEDQKAATDLAWALKEMLHDIGEKGQAELERRLTANLGRKLAAPEREALKNTVSPAMIQATAKRWFPKLKEEVDQHRSGTPPDAAFMDLDDMEERLSFDPANLGRNWTRTDADLTLAYRPASHADPFLKLWLSLARAADDGANGNPANRLFKSLGGASDKVAAGRCLKCHTQSDQPASPLHWTGKRPDLTQRMATRFSHASHFHLLEERNCVTCHHLNFSASSEDYLAAFDYYNPEPALEPTCNFRNINKSTCAQCHTKESAGDNCLSCHNYHVGSFGRIPPGSGLIQALPGVMEP